MQSKVTALLASTPGASLSHQFATAVYSGAAPGAIAAAPPAARATLTHVARVSFTSAMNDVLLIAAVVAIVGGLLAFVLIRARDFVGAPVPEQGPASEAEAAVLA